MNSIQAFKMPYAPKTPAHFQDDSGYGSMMRTFQDNSVCEHDVMSKSMCIYCTSTENSKFSAIRRPKIVSIETVKKKLFPGSPYSPEGSSSRDSLKSSERKLTPTEHLRKQRMTKFAEHIKHLSFIATKPAYRLPPKCPNSPPVKFYYSPLKNSRLFRSPESSPRESAVPVNKTGCAPNSKSWGASLSLPEQCHDLLKKIADKNLTLVVSSILSHLSDKDLYRVGCVSSIWKQIVFSDSKARQRREDYVARRLTCKENKRVAIDMVILRANVTEGDRELLLDVTNRELFKQSLPSRIPTPKSEHFLAIAKGLRNTEVLLKCPRCQHPAKCLMGNKYHCTRDSCYYAFCRKCLGLHASHACPSWNPFKPEVIGGKQSKRNLKRL